MILAPSFAGKRVGVFGLARTGQAAARALQGSGAQVFCWDDAAGARASVDQTVTDLVPLMPTLDGLLLSPGVPLYFPQPLPAVVQAARAANVPILGDTEIFAQARATLPAHKLIGITGTNGKSTTAALIHHVLLSAGLDAALAGNIGVPLLDEEPLAEGGIYVLELSSFQIDLTHSLACDVAVLTNITPDHLDRHGNFEAYAAAKARLFDMQTAQGWAVIGSDDPVCQSISVRGPRVLAKPVAGQDRWPSLQGPHNAQNAACAFAATEALGLPASQILAAFETYPGLLHRMERVATLDGILFINDSKATNATSTAPALGAYPHIHWIAGGKPKSNDLDACLPYLGHVRGAYVIGEAAPLFERLLTPHVPVVHSGTLAQAVADAFAAAKSGDVILLSPACASYDQFRDFEDRGAQFRAEVLRLNQGSAVA
jgi:UDP-N-acetylmuramoylalanine--D-glutamate ligase